ncbi:Pre-mRNA-processing factor 39 [Neofusicoccum parvum]|uniref:Pre-mRNA-processing factor 39 n=1 Tax=Neofusicoccum parvum TaxID=310453 RepID=A0ACB5S043_9PEZI|nr:Pre-mRNA-processing factor 39 [Neofusicoccum parvum]
MADLTFLDGEEYAELKKFNQEVLESPDDFEAWEKLVRTCEGLEGGLNRNSSPNSIAATRAIYDGFLAHFPLVFGYWKKYADLEFSIAGTEAAEMVYERGVASIASSVDLWANYCSFKVETNHDSDVIRELFERGAASVGLDFLAHPFWDKYLEFEERLEAVDKIFAILNRIITIPMHQYARYFERFRQLAQTRPLSELVPAELLTSYRNDLTIDPASSAKSEIEIERDLRSRIDAYHLEIFQKTQTETTKRWTYEQEIKRPYFHVTELDEAQLANWAKYLDFEESEGGFDRAAFLYERCLVTCAYEDAFWLRYARWMQRQEGHEEEVRNIYMRASCLYVPIARPTIRLHYAIFEESAGRVDIAHAIHEAILFNLPGHFETVVSWASLAKRQDGVDAAIKIYREQIESPEVHENAKGAFVAQWAELLWKSKGAVDAARELYQTNALVYLGVSHFWEDYLKFEIAQPATEATQKEQTDRIRQVHNMVVQKSKLSQKAARHLTHIYMKYLLENGGKDAAKEFLELDSMAEG